MRKKSIIYIVIGLLLYSNSSFSQCGSGTPSYTANLTATPNATWASPSAPRNDTCCGWSGADVCVKFTIFLNPNSVGINFGIASGAIPPGALFYSINCGPPIPVGTPICLSGQGPHILTFCKPGNNSNSYSITAIPAPVVPDSIMVRDGCTQTLSVSGFSVPTITWNSINPGPPGAYNLYLSCTSGCATVTVTPTGMPPAFVDYLVGGFAQSPCQANYYQDTVRVYFYSNLLATINPTLSTICFGSTNAVLTVSASGGLPPYTYSWVPTGNTTTIVSVGPGTHTALVFDNTGCPPTTATAVVNQYTLPITANAGPDFMICKGSPTVALSGTVTNATGGIWSGGTGTFSPVSNSVNTNYIPTAAELVNGSVQLYLTTTGNSGCPPKQDTVIVSFQNVSLASAGSNTTVCANNNIVALSGTVSGFSSTGQWSTNGTGIFTSTTNLNTFYTPSSLDVSTGSVNIILTSTGNGVCPPVSSTLVVTITPAPIVNAGTGGSLCSSNSFSLNGSVISANGTGTWSTNGNGSFSPSPNILNASYIPGINDVATGSVTLTLTSTNNGNCLAVSDTIIIAIKQIAFVNAGINKNICSNTPTVSLTGTVSGVTSSGVWGTSGSGAFALGNSAITNTYFVSVADLALGVVIFTLSSTNNGPCPVVTDTMLISITPIAIVNAGSNQFICSNSPLITLNGNVTSNSNSGTWTSSGGGIYNPSNNVLNPTYSITTSDASNGSVTFTLSSSNNGPCPIVRDTVLIKIKKLAVVNAGPDITVCSTSLNAPLNGSVSIGSTTGVWSTNGTGNFSPNNSTLNGSYNISLSDINNGMVLFILTSTNNEVCPSTSDTTKLTILKKPFINSLSDTTICSYQNPLKVTTGVSGGSGQYVWSTSGSGSFVYVNAFNTVNYTMSSSDIAFGSVKLTISSINNGACGEISSSINVVINPAPTANFSASTYTANIPNDPIQFTNQSVGANSYYWSFGDGGFTNLTNPLHNYVTVGFYTVTLVAINQFNCKDTVEKDILVISDIQFPNVFTPNQNGSNGGSYNPADLSNDIFFPYTSGVVEYQLQIFNRWGELIFQSQDIKIGWDGYFNGKLCQQDAYVWKANVKFFDGRTYKKTGNVTLLR
ncbi:MAG: PKD domain-containing protein [Bacteroidota bacterium]|nr:PKD domain-containing protein [Bacteroidota bacterium]